MNSTTVQIRRQEPNPVLTAAICLLLAEYTINFEVTVMVTLAAADMRVVNQSNTVGDEHEHS